MHNPQREEIVQNLFGDPQRILWGKIPIHVWLYSFSRIMLVIDEGRTACIFWCLRKLPHQCWLNTIVILVITIVILSGTPVVKNLPAGFRDMGLIPGLKRFPATCCIAAKPVHRNSEALMCSRACALQHWKPPQYEACAVCNQRVALSPPTRESLCRATNPARSKKKKKIL